ncbi:MULTISPECIES: hypothetical protein [Pseudomonas]|uniref:Uncharacterized protein n=1 Tax=Pseudomonas hunanensis TaxID=1247546 RepID=A0ACC6K7E9_9PSED|nr:MULTISPECIES: hypothetical protein [Pseudomonas]MBP2263503.1 hypothetical protein [Pseudomonas sp. BP8]MDR6714341.1 hypothetical protein [Pseudomonas hunanensis]HDS1737585.1 hypothetical protein [Pseudomonas putida]
MKQIKPSNYEILYFVLEQEQPRSLRPEPEPELDSPDEAKGTRSLDDDVGDGASNA